jgi:hypothetical protein
VTREAITATFGELGRLLDRSGDLERELNRMLGGEEIQLHDDSTRTLVTLSAAQTSMEHGVALRTLLAQPLPTAGISMMRLQHEALTRAAWLLLRRNRRTDRPPGRPARCRCREGRRQAADGQDDA